jgi:hypothetical protein
LLNSDGDGRIIAFGTSVADYILKAIHSIKARERCVRDGAVLFDTHSSIPWLSWEFGDHEVTTFTAVVGQNVDIYRLSLIRGGNIVLRYGRGLETIDGTLGISTRAKCRNFAVGIRNAAQEG